MRAFLFIFFLCTFSVGISSARKPQYCRHVLSENESNSVVLITWEPGSCSPIHSHGGSECTLLVLQGSLVEEKFTFPFAHQFTATTVLQTSVTSHINDDLGMHRICNPFNSTARSLHLYHPPYASNIVKL